MPTLCYFSRYLLLYYATPTAFIIRHNITPLFCHAQYASTRYHMLADVSPHFYCFADAPPLFSYAAATILFAQPLPITLYYAAIIFFAIRYMIDALRLRYVSPPGFSTEALFDAARYYFALLFFRCSFTRTLRYYSALCLLIIVFFRHAAIALLPPLMLRAATLDTDAMPIRCRSYCLPLILRCFRFTRHFAIRRYYAA